MRKLLEWAMLGVLITGCTTAKQSGALKLNKSEFVKTIDGKKTNLYILKNRNGVEVAVSNYGARTVGISVPDKNGQFEDVISGFNTLDEYINCPEPFHGPIVGRVGNRIAKGKFKLDGKEYNVSINNGPNHLHGGLKGFHHRVWDVKSVSVKAIHLHYLSKDGEMGYPGNLSVDVRYALNDENELSISYKAVTDKKTVVNLTWHPFFNLSGEGTTINDHIMEINADYYTPVDDTLIPLGKNVSVKNTPFDFRKAKAIGRDLDQQKTNTQLKHGAGYDHNWVLKRPDDNSMAFAARITDPRSGRVMEIYTQEPGLQFYGGNFFDGKTNGKNGKAQIYRGAMALETQKFPDAPNQPNFPSVVLDKGDSYTTKSIYKFTTSKE